MFFLVIPFFLIRFYGERGICSEITGILIIINALNINVFKFRRKFKILSSKLIIKYKNN